MSLTSKTSHSEHGHASALREYQRSECVVFRKTREAFGGLSNMAAGYPLLVNGVHIATSEALYQACRFPHRPELQRLIIGQRSPMTAKMKGKPYRDDSRADWNDVRLTIMRWCLRVKLAQNWDHFGSLLLETRDRQIVEESRRDDFWGAKPETDDRLIGINALGRLLMELRESLRERGDALRIVSPPDLEGFHLFGQPIGLIADRQPSSSGVRYGQADLEMPQSVTPRQPSPGSTPLATVESEVGATTPPAATSSSQHEANMVSSVGVPKRLIEVDLPIKRISAHARREKSIRHGHISTLHIWWARRPLASCRAVICASLWPDPADPFCPLKFREDAARIILDFAQKAVSDRTLANLSSPESWGRWKSLTLAGRLDTSNPDQLIVLRLALLDFIADYANWDCSRVTAFLETSRSLTESAHEAFGGEPGSRPIVVDPFAGGGAIPLEALRVGADAFASDLNPVAVLLNKAVLEYIPRYGKRLPDELRTWGEWLKEKAEEELSEIYPKDLDGGTPIAYLWARTVISEAPGDGAEAPIEIPLIRSMWLAKRPKNPVAMRWVRDASGAIGTQVMEKRFADGSVMRVRVPLLEIFTPQRASDVPAGTANKGSATCPITGFTTTVAQVRRQLSRRRGGAEDSRLLCVVTTSQHGQGRSYRAPLAEDFEALTRVAQRLTRLPSAGADGYSALPTEQFSGQEPRRIPLPLYGINSFRDMFLPRQALALATYARLIRTLGQQESFPREKDLQDAILLFLSLTLDKVADLANTGCRWEPVAQCPRQLFARQAMPMTWDIAEGVPIGDSSGSFGVMLNRLYYVIDSIGSDWREGVVDIISATQHPLPDRSCDAFITDPPYYYSVPYADLSDFFYVWLRRMIGNRFPALFESDTIVKAQECIQNLPHAAVRSIQKDRDFYESTMRSSLSEGERITKENGVATIVFAHSQTEAWESLLAALISAGWRVTASWPIDTEMSTRIIAQRQSTLASSVHLVCRPRAGAYDRPQQVGDWRDILTELPQRIHQWLPRLAGEGVVGADAIFACLGPALEVFSRYEKVEKASGEQVELREYLEQVWAAVAREAISMIFNGADASGLEEDARITAMWLWTVAAGVSTDPKAVDDQQVNDDPNMRGDGSESTDDDEITSGSKGTGGFGLEYDAARKIAQGLGAHLDKLGHVVEVQGDTARLLAVAERTQYLFGKDEATKTARASRRSAKPKQLDMFGELAQAEEETSFGIGGVPSPGRTVLDKVHQAMILFGAGRADGLRRFVVEHGVGKEPAFWSLAQSLSALYPGGTDEKRWVDGVLARKRGLGF